MLPRLAALILLSGWMVTYVACEPKSDANNVCNSTMLVKKNRVVKTPVKYPIKYEAMCGIMLCTKTREESRIDIKIEAYYDEVSKASCCPGYTETPEGECFPICINSCRMGKCVAPNTCRCDPEPTFDTPGYTGPTCNRFTCLEMSRWGTKCNFECNCPTNSYCGASDGRCLCLAGWRGENCTERCESTMDCQSNELPPIIEPEANVVQDNVIGQSQKLRAELQEPSVENGLESRSVTGLVAAHMSVNVFLLSLTCVLILAIFWYKEKLNKIRNEIYYTYSSGPSSGGSDRSYATPNYSDIEKRPRMPTPDEANYLSKNLSFASATRDILKGQPERRARDGFIIDPKVESHLVESQRNSEKNLYSDIESTPSDNLKGDRLLGSIRITGPAEQSLLSTTPEEGHEYQVPKSLAFKSVDLSPRGNGVDIYENDDSDESNLYEEIKPRTPKY